MSKDEEYLDWYPEKVKTILKCFETICDQERYEDVLASTLIFFVKKHRQCEDKNISLEDHAENLKENFINLNKSFDTYYE